MRRRRLQNRERYLQWRSELGDGTPQPHSKRNARLDLEPDEQIYFHEKGTLYATKDAALGEVSWAERPSDVAFPHFNRSCSRIQRTHCYMTNRRLAFAGKDLDIRIPWEELKKFTVMPGGIVFEATHIMHNTATVDGMSSTRFAFTFQNPLVTADILRFAKMQIKLQK